MQSLAPRPPPNGGRDICVQIQRQSIRDRLHRPAASPMTTAFLEGLNSLFSVVKRRARGYRSKEYQIATPYLVAGKLEIPYYA